MPMVTTLGLDIAKSVFQVHGVDAEGNVRTHDRRTLDMRRRRPAPPRTGTHWSA
jgi:hypothetical protein